MSIVEMASCFACGRDLSRPWAVVKVRGIPEPIPVCSDPCIDAACRGERANVACEHCAKPTDPGDRLPTNAGGVAHQVCAYKVTLALGLEKSSMLVVRRMGVLRGGRS